MPIVCVRASLGVTSGGGISAPIPDPDEPGAEPGSCSIGTPDDL